MPSPSRLIEGANEIKFSDLGSQVMLYDLRSGEIKGDKHFLLSELRDLEMKYMRSKRVLGLLMIFGLSGCGSQHSPLPDDAPLIGAESLAS